MAKEIKQKIVLEGEKQYTSAIRDAQRSLKTLKSEMKAETAELGNNATAQQKAEVAAKSLKKQIAEQEEIVKTCQAALERAKTEYGDNAEVTDRWATKLNDARAVLAGMKNDLESASNTAIQSDKKIMETFDRLADYGETISGTIEGIFSTCVSGIGQAAAAVYGEVIDLAGRANALSDLAGFWNTSTTNIQKWQAAVRASSNDVQDLNEVVRKIALGDTKKITELVNVSAVGYEDQWEYAMAVMDALSKMDIGKRNSVAEEIFGGRGATRAFELLNDWDTVLEKLDRYDVENGGIGMTEEQIEQFNQVSVNLATLQTTWEEFKRSFEAGALGKLALDLSSNAQGVLDSLIEFVNADNESDREAALQKLQEELTNFFTRIGEAITAASEALDKVGSELQTSENGTLRTIGKIISGISDLLESLGDENVIENVLKGFRTLADFWLVGKGLQMVNTVAGFVSNLGKITSFNWGGNGGNTPTIPTTQPTAPTTQPTAPTTQPVTTDTGTGTGAGIGALLTSTGAKVLGGAATFVLALTDTNGIVPFSGSRNTAHYDQFVNENGELEQWAKDEGWVLLDNGEVWNPNQWQPENAADKLPEEVKKVDTYGFTLPTKRTPQGKVMGYELTDEQRALSEKWWDDYRVDPTNWDNWDASWDAMEKSFTGVEGVFDSFMDTLTYLEQTMGNTLSSEDLPPFLFSDFQGDIQRELEKLESTVNEKPGITSNDIAKLDTLPSRIEAAVRRGCAGLKVSIDGRPAGEILAPYVSEAIARDIV